MQKTDPVAQSTQAPRLHTIRVNSTVCLARVCIGPADDAGSISLDQGSHATLRRSRGDTWHNTAWSVCGAGTRLRITSNPSIHPVLYDPGRFQPFAAYFLLLSLPLPL